MNAYWRGPPSCENAFLVFHRHSGYREYEYRILGKIFRHSHKEISKQTMMARMVLCYITQPNSYYKNNQMMYNFDGAKRRKEERN